MSKVMWLVVVVAVAACKKDPAPAVAAGSGSGSAAVAAPEPKPIAIDAATPDAAVTGTAVTTPDGLMTVHPLVDFTCEHDEGNVVLCDYTGDRGMSVGFISIADPFTTKVDELAAKIEAGVGKALPEYVKISQTDATCAPGSTGVETWATYTMKGFHLRRRSCVFVKDGHGHSVSFSIPLDDLPKLQERAHALIDAAEFK